MAFPLGSIGAGFFHGLTNNIEQARQGQAEKAKLLGQLLGIAPELPEDIRSQIAPFARPESRMSEVMGGLGLTSAPWEDLNRLTGLAARTQGYLQSIPLAQKRMAGENLQTILNPAITPTDFKYSMPDETNPLPDENRPLALAPPPKVDLTQTTQTSDIPQHLRTYLGLEAKTDPLAALKTYGQYVLREPQKPTVVNQRPGGRSLILNPAGEVTQTIEGPSASESGGPEILRLQRALKDMDDRGVPTDSPARAPIEARIDRLGKGLAIDPVLNRLREARTRMMEMRNAGMSDKDYVGMLRSTIRDNESALKNFTQGSQETNDMQSQINRDRSELNRVLTGIKFGRTDKGSPSPATPAPVAPGAVTLPPELPPGSKPWINPSTGQPGTSNGKPIYEGPDGKKFVVE